MSKEDILKTLGNFAGEHLKEKRKLHGPERTPPPWYDDCIKLLPPFTWFGGKRRVVDIVWENFGSRIPNYIEPFGGGLAVLLGRPLFDWDIDEFRKQCIESYNDLDHFVLNFWRSVTLGDIDEIVKVSNDIISHETEIIARRRFLEEWDEDFAVKMKEVDFYDEKVAGMWLYVLRNWIGGGATDFNISVQKKMPAVRKYRAGWHKRDPHKHLKVLKERLAATRGMARDWKDFLTSATQTTNQGLTGVFLDPPYIGTEDYYSGTSKSKPKRHSIAADVDAWALEKALEKDKNGSKQFKIAVCGYEHNFNPEYKEQGWDLTFWKPNATFPGSKNSDDNRLDVIEVVAFSPSCKEEIFTNKI